MEFLLVAYAGDRDVTIDGSVSGITNHLITLAPGTYVVSLAGAADFSPPRRTVVVDGTSPLDPMKVTFA